MPATGPTVFHDLHRRPFPAQVIAQETTGQAIADSTTVTIVFDSELADVESQYNPATGIFTARIAGLYQVSTYLMLAGNASFACGEFFRINVQLNAAVYVTMFEADTYGCGATSVQQSGGGTTLVPCSAGDTISILCRHNSGAAQALSGTATQNWLNIIRLGP